MFQGIEIRAVYAVVGNALVTLGNRRVSGPLTIDSGNRTIDMPIVAVNSGVRSIVQIAVVPVGPSVIEVLMAPWG